MYECVPAGPGLQKFAGCSGRSNKKRNGINLLEKISAYTQRKAVVSRFMSVLLLLYFVLFNTVFILYQAVLTLRTRIYTYAYVLSHMHVFRIYAAEFRYLSFTEMPPCKLVSF